MKWSEVKRFLLNLTSLFSLIRLWIHCAVKWSESQYHIFTEIDRHRRQWILKNLIKLKRLTRSRMVYSSEGRRCWDRKSRRVSRTKWGYDIRTTLINSYIHAYIHTWTFPCLCSFSSHVYIYSCIHTYHTYTHTHTCTCRTITIPSRNAVLQEHWTGLQDAQGCDRRQLCR